MTNYHKLIQDNLNYALEPNKYLDEIKNEDDKEKRFNILKKYFVENITKNIYQNMDLLQTVQTNFDKFKHTHNVIGNDLFLNILFAIKILVAERQGYQIDISKINICENLSKSIDDENNNEYTICESYINLFDKK